MNAPTKQLHGLKAAAVLVNMVRNLITAGGIQGDGASIELDNGITKELTLSEYADLAKEALEKAVSDLKQQHNPLAGRN